jgi:hypothetical protein
MKKLLALALVPLIGFTVLSGCTTSAPAKKPESNAKGPNNDPRRVGLELVRQAPDAARCWEGLQLLNSDIQQRPATRDRLHLKPEARQFLQTEAGLSEDELQEVDSPTFRRTDAHYLAECFLLRDLERALEVAGMPPEELASNALAWVNRHVLLHQQGDDWLPPVQVLQRGYGSLRDRARVFLALLRQIPMEGAAVVLSEAPDDPVLIAAIPATSRDRIYLFDLRQGTAVRTADGKIATLQDAQQDPKLLGETGLDAKQLAGLQLRLACPLNALAVRMQDLEQTLQVQDRITVYLAVAGVQQDLHRLSQLPVNLWNTPVAAGRTDPSPTRALRLFLPPEEGGIDKTDRRNRFQADLVPRLSIQLALEQINLGEQLPPVAREHLLRLIEDLLKKYELQPQEMVLHGKGEDAIRRLERAEMFFDDENLDRLADDPAFPRAVAEWRENMRQAYSRLASKDADGQAAVNKLWAEDQFLMVMLQTDREDPLSNAGLGQDRRQPPKKTVITSIVAYAVRDHLRQRALWTRAMVWHDKAQREQEKAEREQDQAKRAQRRKGATGAWLNTRAAWSLCLDRAAVSPTGRQKRLDSIRLLLKQPDPRTAVMAAQLLATLQLELHQHYAARIHNAVAVYHLDGAKAAVPLLRGVDEELAVLVAKDKTGQIGLQGDVTETLKRLHAASVTPPLIRSTELLASDWAATGNYDVIRQQVARRLAQWDK